MSRSRQYVGQQVRGKPIKTEAAVLADSDDGALELVIIHVATS